MQPALRIFRGDGDGAFGPLEGPFALPLLARIAAADFTGDGVPDLAVSDIDATIRMFKGSERGDGHMEPIGVLNVDPFQALTTLGVPLAQGWLLARPGSGWPTIDPDTSDLVRRWSAAAQVTTNIAGLVRECVTIAVPQWHGDLTAAARRPPAAMLPPPTGRATVPV